MSNRLYGICCHCGDLVYREPGKRHGDGQVDSDDHPVWLLDCAANDPELPGREEGAEAAGLMVPSRTVDCGCTTH